jgi:hypothetical protein
LFFHSSGVCFIFGLKGSKNHGGGRKEGRIRMLVFEEWRERRNEESAILRLKLTWFNCEDQIAINTADRLTDNSSSRLENLDFTLDNTFTLIEGIVDQIFQCALVDLRDQLHRYHFVIRLIKPAILHIFRSLSTSRGCDHLIKGHKRTYELFIR